MTIENERREIEEKRLEEQEMVEEMIAIYCEKKHRTKGKLCPQCQELLTYARERASKCPFMETKTFCSACPVHCYRKDMREKIKEVMKFSGPRMLLRRPRMAIRHMIVTIQSKRNNKK